MPEQTDEKKNYVTIRNVPDGLKRSFKLAAMKEGKTMRVKIIEMMARFVTGKEEGR